MWFLPSLLLLWPRGRGADLSRAQMLAVMALMVRHGSISDAELVTLMGESVPKINSNYFSFNYLNYKSGFYLTLIHTNNNIITRIFKIFVLTFFI